MAQHTYTLNKYWICNNMLQNLVLYIQLLINKYEYEYIYTQ